MKKNILIMVILFSFLNLSLPADEGMWPLSELDKLDLGKAGFEISAREIYSPDGSVSLIDAIINLSGCTASFISANGLILTNHHCAFGSIQDASTKQADYLRDGLVTSKLGDEIPAKGMTVKITESYRDVSGQVLSAIKKNMTPLQRTKALEKQIKSMEIEAEKKNKGKRAEIAEMFQGKVYVLFLSTYLKDVRLVYAPPRSIGEFGGETDNWVWPRHTGDFTLLRAYVGANGESAAYAPANVPYKPKKFLKVAPQGVSEGDLMFILGYPGSTYRHRPASYLRYEEETRMPAIVSLYQWLIQAMEKAGEDEREVQLKLAASIKGLANRMKNYQGKLKGLRNLHLTMAREKDEESLAKIIENEPLRKEYLALQKDMGEIYGEMSGEFPFQNYIANLTDNWGIMGIAYKLVEYSHEKLKKDEDREYPYMTRNLDKTRERLIRQVKNLYPAVDQLIADHLLDTVGANDPNDRLPLAIRELSALAASERKAKIASYYSQELLGSDAVGKWFDTVQLDLLKKSDNPAIKLALEIFPITRQIKDQEDKWKGRLDADMARWLDIKQIVQKERFIPDANSTFRLTWGRIKGYSPRDSVQMKPFTTLSGMVEKGNLGGEYQVSEVFKAMISKAKESRFFQKELGDVPVNILYDADTTGGNSGSPVLNSRGELVGLNFDRSFEATINDYAWDSGYSRSIGVDVRFILWYIESMGGDQLLREINGDH